MKLLNAFVALVIAILVFSPSANAQTNSVSEIASRINSDITQSDTFINSINASTTASELTSAASTAPALVAHLNESSSIYSNNGYTELANGAQMLSNAVNQVANAVNAGDSTVYSSGIDSYNAATDKFNAGVAIFNSSNELSDYGGLLGTALFISGLLSLILLIQSFVGNKLLKAEKLRNQHQFSLFKSSLIPLAGTLISYIWYVATPPGETYTMLWGIVLFGYIAFFGALIRYFKDVRPEIQKLRAHEISRIKKLSTNAD